MEYTTYLWHGLVCACWRVESLRILSRMKITQHNNTQHNKSIRHKAVEREQEKHAFMIHLYACYVVLFNKQENLYLKCLKAHTTHKKNVYKR